MAKDLEYYIAQARRIEEHRVAGVEKEIRKLYKSMMADLQQFMSGVYVQHAEDDKLTYAMLQKAGYDARFLEEIEQRLNISTPKAAAELRKLVEETYKAAYEGMVQGVVKAAQVPLDAVFAGSVAITPEQIRAAVENPVSGLTLSDRLEKNRKEIIYNIKQAVGVGLMNGDRYTTMAKRIAEHLDGDYKKAIRIARTEAHRVREAGNSDAAVNVDKELQGGTTGMRLVKTWRSMKDERVRPQQRRKTGKGWKTTYSKGPANHMKMDGQVRLADEPFDMGHHNLTAMAPGQSGNAGDDINCRCYASYTMMSDAEYYAKTGKHFPGNERAARPAPEFKPAKTIEEAESFMQSNLNADATVNYKGANLQIANEWNRGMQDNLERFPELKDSIRFVGSCQNREKEKINVYFDEVLESYKLRNPHIKNESVLYPYVTKHIEKYYVKKIPGNVYAQSSFSAKAPYNKLNGVTFNNTWSHKRFMDGVKADVASGFHPVGTDTIRSILDHEIGHQIDDMLSLKTNPDIVAIWNRGEKAIESGLSRYSVKNSNPEPIREMIAEGWAEYCNNPAPRPIAMEIGQIIEREYSTWKSRK